jgi:photosystem II stability/assembly factor-like uncharacterized protein
MKHALVLCLLLNALVASGQISYWEELPAPPGGAPTRVTQIANGWVYAEFYDHAVFCSQDNGLHWQQIFWPSSDPDTGFAKITVGRAGTLFAERRVDDNDFAPFFFDVYTSVDNGATWQLLLDSSAIHGLGETSNGTLFGLIDTANVSIQAVVRSDNGGGTWAAVKSQNASFYYFSQIDVGGYDEIWVGRNDPEFVQEVFYSVDNGDTWKYKYISVIDQMTLTFSNTLLYTDFNNLCRYTANGTTVCFSIDSSLLPSESSVQSLIQMPDSSIYAITSNYLYKSVNDGITWQRVGTNNGMLSFLNDRPLFDGTWISTNRNTMARSTDLAASWSFSAFGINRGGLYDLYLHTDQEWLAWTGNGLWYTSNSGQTWDLRLDRTGLITGKYQENMVTDSIGNIWIVAKDSLLFTPDLGQTFLNITPPINLSASRLGLNVAQSALFVGTAGKTLRTLDNGKIWEIMFDSMQLRKMVPHPSGALLAIFDSSYWRPNGYFSSPWLYQSNDDGQTWYRLSMETIGNIAVATTGEIFAPFGGITWRSTDMGATWIGFPSYVSSIVPEQGGHLFSFGNVSIKMSLDNGNQWQNLPIPDSINDIGSSIFEFQGFDSHRRMYISGWQFADSRARGYFFRTSNPTNSGAWLTGTVFKDADGDCSTQDPESPARKLDRTRRRQRCLVGHHGFGGPLLPVSRHRRVLPHGETRAGTCSGKPAPTACRCNLSVRAGHYR